MYSGWLTAWEETLIEIKLSAAATIDTDWNLNEMKLKLKSKIEIKLSADVVIVPSKLDPLQILFSKIQRKEIKLNWN